jgi:glycerophosphoryl diester phosphodiesterase
MEDAGASELWQEAALIDRDLVSLVHDASCVLYAWTVDDVGVMRTLADLGVDGLCTNRPAAARPVFPR